VRLIYGFSTRIGFNEARQPRASWISKAFPDTCTGYHFLDAIREWLHDNLSEFLSVAEVLQAEGECGVGEAQAFVSHVQCEPLQYTLRHLHDDKIKYWIDYLILRACQKGEFKPLGIASLVRSIGNTIAVVDDECQYFSRLFCIFEAAATPNQRLEIRVSPQTLRAMESTLRVISSQDAKCRDDKHTEEIRVYIEQLGGHSRVDSMVVAGINSEAQRRNWNFRMSSANAAEEMMVLGAMMRALQERRTAQPSPSTMGHSGNCVGSENDTSAERIHMSL